MFKQKFLILCFIYICFISCAKEEYIHEEFVPPTFKIISNEIISDDECILAIEVNSGVGAKLQSINIELKDITDNTNEAVHRFFSLNEDESQIVKAQIKVPHKKHDYRAHITLKSAKSTYNSNPFFLRFSEEFSQDGIKYIYFSPYVLERVYVNEKEKTALNLKKGQRFYFMIEYSKLILKENSIQVKLNGEYQLGIDSYTYGILYDGEIGIHCVLPDNIEPGAYNIHVYINNLEYILDYKINIVKSIDNLINIARNPINDGNVGFHSAFLFDNTIYYISPNYSPHRIFSYNLDKTEWTESYFSIGDYLRQYPKVIFSSTLGYLHYLGKSFSLISNIIH
jgi:hypothetical protein